MFKVSFDEEKEDGNDQGDTEARKVKEQDKKGKNKIKISSHDSRDIQNKIAIQFVEAKLKKLNCMT